MDVDFNSLVDQGATAGAQSALSTPALKNLTGALATGAAVGAALGTVIPGLGNIVGGVVGSVAGVIVGLAPLVSHAFKGQCTMTIDGLDSDCRDYPAHVATAAKWLHEHPDAALHLTPAAFSRQAHILEQDFGEWFEGRGEDYRERIHDSEAWQQLRKLPGARTLLRLAQVPAAAAIAGASPTQAPQLRSLLPRTFPAILPHDLDAISAKAADIHRRQLAAAPSVPVSHPTGPGPALVRPGVPSPPQAHAPSSTAVQTPIPAVLPVPAPTPLVHDEPSPKPRKSASGAGAVLAISFGVAALAGIAVAVALSAGEKAPDSASDEELRRAGS